MTNNRILGIDYGSVRTGIAVSDPSLTLASPLVTIDNNRSGFDKLNKLIEEWGVKTVVVGYPFNLKGEKGAAAAKVETFINRLSQRGMEIIRWDERFTTQSAVELLHQAGVKPHKDKARIDRSAAALILQNYLDYRKQNPPE